MSDPWSFSAVGQDSPATSAAAVTPGTAVLDPTPRALWVGGAGNVVCTPLGGGTATIAGVAAGSIIPLRVTTVGTATTATLIVALW